MPWRVELTQGVAVHYVFVTDTPWTDPEGTAVYKEGEEAPAFATLVGWDKTWTIEGVLTGANEDAVIEAWKTLQAALEDPADHPDGVRLVRTPGDVVEDRIGGADHVNFRIGQLRWLRKNLKRHLRSEIVFSLTVSARQVLAADGVTKLTMQDSYVYDDACGLLTRTISGELTMSDGSSAEAAARALLATPLISLPDSTFVYGIKGPENGNVTILDEDDTRASFVQSIVQSGKAFPSQDLAPGFSVQTTTTKQNGQESTTVAVTARGPIASAQAAVRAQRPAGGVISETESVNEQACVVTATYVTAKTDKSNNLVNSRSFNVSGGGQPIRHSEMSGGLLPIRHVLPITECVIHETISVEFIGAPRALAAWQIPPALPLPEDNLPTFSPTPVRVAVGGGRDSDRWRMTVTRTYRTAGRTIQAANLFDDAVQTPNAVGTSAEAELERGAGSGVSGTGGGGSITVGNIGSFPGLTFGGIAGRARFGGI